MLAQFSFNAHTKFTLHTAAGLAGYSEKKEYGSLTFTKEGMAMLMLLNLFGNKCIKIPLRPEGPIVVVLSY